MFSCTLNLGRLVYQHKQNRKSASSDAKMVESSQIVPTRIFYLADNQPSLAIFTRRINCKTNLIFEQAQMAVGVALMLTERARADELYSCGGKRWPTL